MSEDLDQLKAEEKAKTIDVEAALPVQSESHNGDVDADDNDTNDKGNAWIGGVVLIAIGVIFLINNYTDFGLANWWALFILIPALAILSNAARAYRAAGRITSDVTGSLIGGLIMLFVASIFLFELDWSQVWPMFIVFAGLGALLNALFDKD